jgi:hypothetical protein
MIRPTVELMRDATPRLEAEPGDGADHQHIDADTVLQSVENLFDPLIDKADRADLHGDKLFFGVWTGHPFSSGMLSIVTLYEPGASVVA